MGDGIAGLKRASQCLTPVAQDTASRGYSGAVSLVMTSLVAGFALAVNQA